MFKHKLWVAALMLLLGLSWFTLNAHAATNTTITADTNGYPSYIYVNASDVTSILNQAGSNITYTSIGSGYIFLADDGARYDVITTNPPNLTLYDAIEVNSTILINADFDGKGATYYRGRGLGNWDEIFDITGSNIEVYNFRVNGTRHTTDAVEEIMITGNNVELHHVEVLEGSTRGIYIGGDGANVHHCLITRAAYGIMGPTNKQVYNGTIWQNQIQLVTRRGILCQGFVGFNITDNIIWLNQGDTDAITKIGIDFNLVQNITDVIVANNTIIRTNYTQAAQSWGMNFDYEAAHQHERIHSAGNRLVGLTKGIWCDAGSSYLDSTGDWFINCTADYTDNGANNWTTPISTNKPYYTDYPNYAGSYGRAVEVYSLSGVLGNGYHYGLFPAVYTEYLVDVSWAGDTDGVYVDVGGVRLQLQCFGVGVRVFLGTQDGTITYWDDNDNATRAYLKVVVDTRRGGGTVYWMGDEDGGAAGLFVPFYYNKYDDHNAALFTPTHFYVFDRDASVSTIENFKQRIYTHGFADAIGSRTHQALGFDGVRTWDKIYMGLEDISTLGNNCTLLMDTGYVSNNTYVTYLKNTGFELGIHVNPTAMDTLTNDDFEGNFTSQDATIAALWGVDPMAYTILGTGRVYNESRMQWIANNMSYVQRANRVTKIYPDSEKLQDSTFNYLDNGTTQGYAVAPLYGHETEPSPPIAGELDGALWDLWITHVAASPVEIVGNYEWYMIQSNINTLENDAVIVYALGDAPPNPYHVIEKINETSYKTTFTDATEVYNTTAWRAIQAACDSVKVLYGDTIQIKAANYKVNQTLILKNGVTLLGETGTVLNVTDMISGDTVLYATGSIGGGVGLTANAYETNSTIYIAGDISVVPGDLVMVYSSAVWHNNTANLKQGEIRRVVGVSGGNLTLALDKGVDDTYYMVDSSVAKITPVEGITVQDISIVNELNRWDTGGASALNLIGIWFKYAVNITIANCTMDGMEDRAVRFDNVVNSTIRDSTMIKATLVGSGYGVDIVSACQNILIDNNYGYYNRHFIVGADTTTAAGVPRDITISNNLAYDSKYWTGAAWGVQNIYDSHQEGERIHFIDNEAYGTGYGLNYMSYSGNITGNIFHDLTFYGITISSPYVAGITSYQDDVLVENNTIYTITSYGIRLGQAPPSSNRSATNVRVLDNNITDCPTAGVYLEMAWDNLVSDNLVTGSTHAVSAKATTYDNLGRGNTPQTINDLGVNNDFIQAPTSTTPTGNTTIAGALCSFSSSLGDETGLSHYVFSYYNGSAYVNDTIVAIGGGLSYNMVVVKTLNGTTGATIRARVYVNDTDGNWVTSGVLTFPTTSLSTTPTCNITGPVNATRQNIGSQVNVTWSYNDLDGDAQGWYQVQVDDTAGFGSPTFDTGKLAGAATVYTVTLSTTPNLYYMRVRVWDTDNNVSAYTAPRTAIADRVNITGLWVNDTTPYEGETVEISCTAALAYDGHVLNGSAPSNDTLTLRSSLGDNIVMTYNGTHWVGSLTKVTVSTAIINNYQSVLETNYTITVLGMAGFSETITWDVAPVTGGGGGSALLPLLVAVMMFGMGMVGGGRRRR